MVFKHSPVVVSQIRIKPSWLPELPETIMVPSLLNSAAVTGSEWAANVERQ
eukprot:CAMPEP_0117885530 /NCGR_PEP_ID=MMETSP0950-20121206/19709_2 /TAXON_ID=44440 /ORGANISM="Chattonella subsalsa, Strain CCMP2191" /LENGTH=50 /DNA_ID=CAMNT_0005742463 /DNA_START=484 /DNA_END=633 /DNA_ORIENTATION=-